MSAKKRFYSILGVKENASKEDIKSAYREKAKKDHPDKGGDKEKFQELTLAYSILNDPKKKKRYDETGNENPELGFESRFMALINQIFMQIIEKCDIETTDLVKEFKSHLKRQKDNFNNHKKEQTKKAEKYEKVLKRVKAKTNQTIITVLTGHISQCKNNLIELDEEIEFVDKVILVLESYGYDFETIQTYRPMSGVRFTFDTEGGLSFEDE